MDNKYDRIAIAIRKIQTVYFIVNERLARQGNERAALDFGQRNEFIPELSIFSFVLRVVYRYADSPDDEILAAIEVSSTFEIENFATYIDSEQRILLPENVWLSLASMALAHTRALFAERLASTVYRNFIIPIMDAKTFVDRFFPILPVEENKG